MKLTVIAALGAQERITLDHPSSCRMVVRERGEMMMEVGQEVTNGTRISSGRQRLFRVIAIDGPDAWVFAMNGKYRGERLTFPLAMLAARGGK